MRPPRFVSEGGLAGRRVGLWCLIGVWQSYQNHRLSGTDMRNCLQNGVQRVNDKW